MMYGNARVFDWNNYRCGDYDGTWYDKRMEELGCLLGLQYLLYIHTLKRIYIRGYGVRAVRFPQFSCLNSREQKTVM